MSVLALLYGPDDEVERTMAVARAEWELRCAEPTRPLAEWVESGGWPPPNLGADLSYRIVYWQLDPIESELQTIVYGRPVAVYRRQS